MAESVSGDADVIGTASLRVAGQELVLYDIQMPGPDASCAEWRGRRQQSYACDEHAAAVLKSLVAGETVSCVLREEGSATCYSDGGDIAEALVAQGWARSCGRSNRYVNLEQAARDARRGLWAGNFMLAGGCAENRQSPIFGP